MTSYVALRSSARFSAGSGTGRPRRSRPARMKASIGLATSATAGTSGRTSGRNAQCSFHSAPSSIQRVTVSTCVAESRAPSGGICTSGSVEVIRSRISLAAESPGTIARDPLSSAAVAPACWSSRRPPSCVSGPWQATHRFASSGWMSREKSMLPVPGAAAADATHASIRPWAHAPHRTSRNCRVAARGPMQIPSQFGERVYSKRR